MMNRQEEARRLLANMLITPQPYEFGIAIVYFRLGESEEGWKWLEKAYDERSFSLIFLKVHTLYDNIRSDPRFQALLKKMGVD